MRFATHQTDLVFNQFLKAKKEAIEVEELPEESSLNFKLRELKNLFLINRI